MGREGFPIRVLLVGADTLALFGLARLLAAHDQLSLLAERKPGVEIENTLAEEEADVVLWDLGPGPNVDAQPLERFARDQELPVIALVPGEGASGEALAAGARGVLLRDADGERLLTAVLTVVEGLVVVDPALVPPSFRTGSTLVGNGFESLTPRETEVLQFLAQGLANKAIADRMRISEHTVKFHVNSILGKLGAQSRTDALVRAARLGLIAL